MDNATTSAPAPDSLATPAEAPASHPPAAPSEAPQGNPAAAPQSPAEAHTAAIDGEAQAGAVGAGAAQPPAAPAQGGENPPGEELAAHDDASVPRRPHDFLGVALRHPNGHSGVLASLRFDKAGQVEAIRLQHRRGLSDWLSPDGFEPAE